MLEKAPTKTFFAGLLGIDSFKITAKSTACSPCGIKPLDVMMVLDRTGSMCQTSSARTTRPARLEQRGERHEDFLSYMEPTTQWVGLTVLPPATGPVDRALRDAERIELQLGGRGLQHRRPLERLLDDRA